MKTKIVDKANQIINQSVGAESYCVLSLIDSDGYPTSSTISIAKADGIKWLTFCTGNGTNPRRIYNCNHASVCINSPSYNISLKGYIEILTDLETKEEMWYSGLENHFSGPNDPNFCVLKFNTTSYNLLIDWEEEKGTI